MGVFMNGLWTEWDREGKKTFEGTFKDGNEQQFLLRTDYMKTKPLTFKESSSESP